MMERAKRLAREALHIVTGPRQQAYGPPTRSFETIAGLWSAYLGQQLTPRDVALLLALLKISRARTGGREGREDSYRDLIGYALLTAELDETLDGR